MGADTLPQLTNHIAARTAGVEIGLLPPGDVERARHSLIDWLAAAIAGSAVEPARSVWAALDRTGGSAGPATVVGTQRRATVRDAAFANGVAAHSLELDDIAGLMGGHPSVSVCTAVLTLADVLDASGNDALAGIIAGYDAACRIAVAFGPGHAAAGWHVTGTIGTFAAAAGCARLLRLDVAQIEAALGLAASSAAGLNAAIGSSAKATHAGNAAAAGMLAALLAAEGATGPSQGIEHYAAAAGAVNRHHPPGRARRPAGHPLDPVQAPCLLRPVATHRDSAGTSSQRPWVQDRRREARRHRCECDHARAVLLRRPQLPTSRPSSAFPTPLRSHSPATTRARPRSARRMRGNRPSRR